MQPRNEEGERKAKNRVQGGGERKREKLKMGCLSVYRLDTSGQQTTVIPPPCMTTPHLQRTVRVGEKGVKERGGSSELYRTWAVRFEVMI